VGREDAIGQLQEGYNREECVLPHGLAKDRMRQYLESQAQAAQFAGQCDTDAVVGKGVAKSLLAKWKSMEHVEQGARFVISRGNLKLLSIIPVYFSCLFIICS
jgi:hypothetical protein